MFKKLQNKVFKNIKQINDSYEFKPVLSEIEEAPMNPLGRFMFHTVIALISITILWLFIGKTDIVVNARGIIIPDGEAKIIQPLESGVVKNIFVNEGDFVKKGQLLISIDTTSTNAELDTVKKNLEQSRLEAERQNASGKGVPFLEKLGELTTEQAIQKNIYIENLTAIKSTVSEKEQEIKQLNHQITSTTAQKRDYEFQLASAKSRLNRLSNVKDIIAYNEYEQAVEKTITLEETINKTNAEIRRLQAQKQEISYEIKHIEAEFRAQNFSDMAETQKKIYELQGNQIQLEFSNKNQSIIAPCDGYIDKLNIHTIGGIVTPAQELIALTPAETPLIIKAKVLNKDIGFIRTGMPVSVKIDTFDFQKYGILHGKVKSVSQNSIEDENLGPVYETYIISEQNTYIIDGKEQPIAAGMTLNAEIEIGKRRIIEFFIYPLIKYMDEGISVR